MAMRIYSLGVFHKAWVGVNEKRTEAAAVTGIPFQHQQQSRRGRPYFERITHLSFSSDTRSGSILFLGRMAQPA
jgi:serine protease inhibitor